MHLESLFDCIDRVTTMGTGGGSGIGPEIAEGVPDSG